MPAIGYDNRPGTDVLKPTTLTDKAHGVMVMAGDVLDRCATLEQRLWPTAEKAGAAVVEEDPDALPWILEAADARLQRALEIMNCILERA